jgi:hypothetical protein
VRHEKKLHAERATHNGNSLADKKYNKKTKAKKQRGACGALQKQPHTTDVVVELSRTTLG